MKWKYTRACLASNKFCGAIVDERTVFCVCGQKVTLDNDYDESRLNEHSNNSRCKVNNKKRQLGLPGLFPVLPNPPKKKKNFPSSSPLPILSLSSSSPLPTLSSLSSSSPLPTLLSPFLYPNKPCPGLRSEQIRSYINRTPFIYEEVLQFNQQIIAESKWFIDHFGICIRSVNCKRKTHGQISSSCSLLYSYPCFMNRVKAVAPDPKNTKYTPKFYYNNNPLLSYLKNNHIKQLHSILFDKNLSSKEF
ncbi:hypothetical protein C2G38_2217041 [Gigaspora rosea]|uniref:Uncharacterized protein n=1 Tax=Gigaspora rosea TaxID=44941 RepID=A0A397U9S5_9GLOM|nr:hypothetical protein C2G38_2217041 [Gigaspora rosea]